MNRPLPLLQKVLFGIALLPTQISPAFAAPPRIFWADNLSSEISRINLDGTGAQVIFPSDVTQPKAVAVDSVGGKIYYTGLIDEKIKRANLDGSNVEDIVTTGIFLTLDIALDLVNNKIYWLDIESDNTVTLSRANLDGTSIQLLLSGLPFFTRSLAVHPTLGKIYYGQNSDIRRANLDGTNVETLIAGALPFQGLVIDEGRGKLLWTTGDRVRRANLDGTSVETFYTNTAVHLTPSHMAIDPVGDKIYWNESGTGRILRLNLDGTGSVEEAIVTSPYNQDGIAIDAAVGKIYWAEQQNTNTHNNRIRRANLDGSNVEEVINSSEVAFVDTIDLDVSANKMYFLNASPISVQRANLDGTGLETIIRDPVPEPRRVAIDTGAGKMYWPDNGFGRILRANLDGSGFEAVVSGLGYPADVGLDLTSNKLYWLDIESRKIQRSNLDGTNIQDVISGISHGRCFVLNAAVGKIYWVDITKNVIRRANLDGSVVEDVVTGLAEPPVSIAIDAVGGQVYWSEFEGARILRANLDGSGSQVWRTGIATNIDDFDISIDAAAGKLYWFADNGGVTHPYDLTRANLDGTGLEIIGTVFKGSRHLTFDASSRSYFSDPFERKIIRLSADGATRTTLLDGFGGLVDIKLDRVASKVYFTADNKIWRADLNGDELEIFFTGSASDITSGLDIDAANGMIYWIDRGSRKIQRINRDGTNRTDLVTGLTNGFNISWALELDLVNSKMYYTDNGASQILRANLDGTGQEAVITGGPYAPENLAIDGAGGKMYWTDLGTLKIQRANLNGSSIDDFVSGDVSPAWLAIDPTSVPLYTIGGSVFLSNLAQDGLEGVSVSDGTRVGLTNSSGAFTISDVPAGTYTLSASKTGFLMTANSGTNPTAVSAAVTGKNFTAMPRLVNPMFGFWNGFLSMSNILELVNRGSTPLTATITMLDITGSSPSTPSQVVTIAPNGQFDVLVNSLNGFVVDSYGLVKIQFSHDDFDGRISYYRPGDEGYEFAFALPFTNPVTGTSFLIFNSHQPSTKLDERNYLVPQWLSIANLTTAAKVFTVNRYDESGQLLRSVRYLLGPMAIFDIEGGHENPGPNYFGLNEIIPDDINAPYLARLSRYGAASPATTMPDHFTFATAALALPGNGREQQLPISSVAGSDNYIELVNVLNQQIDVSVGFYNSLGALQNGITFTLDAREQQHFYAGQFLGAGQHGLVKISPAASNSVLVNSMNYFRNTADGSIVSVTPSQAREAFGTTLYGSYNLHLGMANWLRLFNVGPSSESFQIKLFHGGAQIYTQTIQVPSNGRLDFPLHETSVFGTTLDTYGPLSVETTTAGALLSELIRVKPGTVEAFDFTMTIPVR